MNLQINIQSIDRTNYVLWKTFSKVDNLNSKVDICSFSTRKYGDDKTWSPSVGDEVQVLDGATSMFEGVIVKIKEVLDGSRIQRYKVKCKDWTHYLDRKLVTERYKNKTVNAIISALVSDYATSFTVTNVDCGITINSIAFNYVTVSQAIQMLAEQVNYSWYVGYDKDIHFFDKNAELSSFNLTDTNGKYIFNSLKIKDDLSQLRNKVIVRGGDKEGTQRTETFDSDGEQTTFPLGYKYSAKPTVTVSGTPLTVGLDFVDQDTDYDVMWNFNEKYIRLTGSPFNEGSPVAATGTPLIPILIEAEEPASIATYGYYEFRKVDKSIETSEEARQYAAAQLYAYKATIKEGTFDTYESGLRSGQTINIQSTIRGIDEDFLVQSVSLKMRGPDDGFWRVELATLRTVGIIDFLQRLLLGETKKIDVGENEVLEKIRTDHQDIQITEAIALEAEETDHASISITESIRKDPWTPEWVLAEYFPSSDADNKRSGRLGISFYLY